MNRTAPLLAVLVLLVAGVAAPAAASAAGSPGTADHAAQAEAETAAPNESVESDSPGAHFAGVIDVQEAEVESELEGRAFGIQVARANSNESKAAVVAEEVDELTRRMEALRDRKQSLSEARENGNISQARYRAEMAALAARSAAVERQLDRTEAASRGMPDHVLESNGVNRSEIETIRNESRSVAASDVPGAASDRAGGGLAAGNASPGRPETVPGQPGPPAEANGSDDNGNGPGNAPGANSSGPPTNAGPPTYAGQPDDSNDRTETSASSSSNGNGATPTSATTTTNGSNASPASNGRGPPEEANDDGTTTSQPDGPGDDETGTDGRGPPSSPGGGR